MRSPTPALFCWQNGQVSGEWPGSLACAASSDSEWLLRGCRGLTTETVLAAATPIPAPDGRA